MDEFIVFINNHPTWVTTTPDMLLPEVIIHELPTDHTRAGTTRDGQRILCSVIPPWACHQQQREAGKPRCPSGYRTAEIVNASP